MKLLSEVQTTRWCACCWGISVVFTIGACFPPIDHDMLVFNVVIATVQTGLLVYSWRKYGW